MKVVNDQKIEQNCDVWAILRVWEDMKPYFALESIAPNELASAVILFCETVMHCCHFTFCWL